jgi:alanine transaminase
VDLNLPEKDQMLRLVEQLKNRLLAGEVVYMHCWGGRGRAATIASCFLAKCYGLGAEETLGRIQRAFDTRKDGGRRSPETEEQQQFVRKFIKELGQ